MSNSRVAVIAIHGVGDHQPFEMARAVGDMLEDLEDGPLHPRYSAFSEDWVRLNVARVKLPDLGEEGPEKPKPLGLLDWLFASEPLFQTVTESGPDCSGHVFMKRQLAGYKGERPDEPYEVLCIKGRRHESGPVDREPNARLATPPEPPAPGKEVHIYEMFWSDLSGVGTAGLRIFGELYQLLFHLGAVGLHNVKAAAVTPRNTKARGAWNRFFLFQFLAANILALPISILNLVMLAFEVTAASIGCLTKISGTQG
jgi:hypothetical protein